jgi:HK97 family phage major capsid protein
MKLKEIQGQLDERRQTLKSYFDEGATDEDNVLDVMAIKALDGDEAARVAAIKALNDEIDDLAAKAKPLEDAQGEMVRAKANADKLADVKGRRPMDALNALDTEVREAVKSFGELFTDSEAGGKYKGRPVEIDMDVKAIKSLMTSASWAPETTRTGRIIDFVTTPIQFIDLIPTGMTSQNAVIHMEETTFENNAAEINEGGQFPEAALGLEEVSSPVRKIAVWLPVTDEQLEDVPQVQGYINNRLPFMIRQRASGQLLAGNGTAPNLSGILDRTGLQTQAKGGDPTPDAIYKAMTKVKVTGQASPNAVVLHPNDAQTIRLLRTSDGIYIWGSPSEAGPARIWGLPMVEAQELTENTGLVGDFNFSEFAIKRGIEVKVSDSHDDFFIKGKQAIRADMRGALVVYRPSAFCEVTGI